jgi:hypothetical protein
MMSELVPAQLRGGLVEFHGIFYVLGYLTATWVGFGCFVSHLRHMYQAKRSRVRQDIVSANAFFLSPHIEAIWSTRQSC